MGRLRDFHDGLYQRLAGTALEPRICHERWLNGRALRAAMASALPTVKGSRVIDIGCGNKPYRTLVHKGSCLIGLDLTNTSAADIVADGTYLPLRDSSVDGAICTEVLEHTKDERRVVAEIARCLRPGAGAVFSSPFLYVEHGRPFDFRRFTAAGLSELLSNDFEIIKVEKIGGIGTVLARMSLLTYTTVMDASPARRISRGLLLPIELAITTTINLVCYLIDRFDTDFAYAHTVVTVRRR